MLDRLPLVLIADNLRSAYNVGSLFRTAEAVGAERLVLTGTSPYPTLADDSRLPYVAERAAKAIAKTALGTERIVPFERYPDGATALSFYKNKGYPLYGLERTKLVPTVSLFNFKPRLPAALIVGEETIGLSKHYLTLVDEVLEIPMFGQKESLNVAVAAGIACYFFAVSSHNTT